MMKEAALFTVSTGILIYFISPVSEEKKVAPEKVEKVESAPRPAQAADDGWGYDDEDDAEEEFVFGQPMVTDDDEDYQEGDEGSDEDGWDTESAGSQSSEVEVAQNTKSRGVHPDSPQGSERGSRDNPIVFKTNNPEDPADD